MEMRPYQQEARIAIREQWQAGVDKTLLVLPTGCHSKDTPILMYNGQIKSVQEIIPGDILMGADGMGRRVLRLHRGREIMCRIVPVKGEPFIVNLNHMLSLVSTKEGKTYPCNQTGGEICNITVREYLQKSKYWKHLRKLYRSEEIPCFFGNNGSEKTVDPYFLGILLGDGDIKNCITRRWKVWRCVVQSVMLERFITMNWQNVVGNWDMIW